MGAERPVVLCQDDRSALLSAYLRKLSAKVVVCSEAEPRVVLGFALGACPSTNTGIGITSA